MKKVKVTSFTSESDKLFLDVGKTYNVISEFIHNGELVGYYISARNKWVVSLNQITKA